MGKWMRSAPMIRAYTFSTLLYTVPLTLVAIGLVVYTRGAVSDADEIVRQASAAAQSGSFETAKVTAQTSFRNIIPEFALIVLIAALAGGTYTRLSLTNHVVRETEVLVEATRTAARGDLTADVEINLNNEYGALQAGVKNMLGAFRTTIGRIDAAAREMRIAASEMTHTSDESSHAIGEVAQAIGSISEGAQHQALLVADVSDVMAEIESSIRDASEHASEAQRQSADTERLADSGVETAAEVLDSMKDVRENSLATAKVIRELGEKSSSIDQIVGAITDIAQQTNMLALNASIEAARAGESGKGFGNVADEVRHLADDAQTSAEQIAGLVRQIQHQTDAAVTAMEEAVDAVERGFETISSNRETFHDISNAVRSLHEGAAEVSELSAGIALGAGQVREQIEEVASVAEESSASTEQVSAATQQTAAAAQEVTESAQRVAETANSLAELAGRFKLPGNGKNSG